MDESFLHLYNAQNAIAILDQNSTDRATQYTVLKFELNNVKAHDLHLPYSDYKKLLEHLEADLSSDSSNILLFHTLNSLLACSISQDEKIPIGSHRTILDIICKEIKNESPTELTTYLRIISLCLSADLYFYLVEMNPEAFAQIFKKCIVADQEIKILILETYSKLYMDDMISLTGIISLINLTINELLIHVFPIMFEEPNDLRVCALNLMSKLVPAFIKSNYRTHSEWINIKQHLTNRYSNTIKNLLINDSDLWHKSWILVVMLLSPEINKSSNIMNKLLSIIEVGLKTQTQIANTWDCWKVLITIYSESSGSGQGIQNPKYIKLLSCPFKRQLKYNTAFDRMFDTWIHLFANIPREQFDENCDLLVRPFIEFSFGVNTTDTLKVKELVPKIFFVFVQMVGHSCEGEKCLSHNSTANSVPHKINGYLASYKVFNTYWKEILQCSGDMIKNLMKLNPLEYKWSDIASCVWSRMLKLINMHFLNSEKISEVQEELLRILSLLVVMSQGNNQLASVCLQSLLTKTAEEFSQKLNFKENKYEFKFIDLITLPCMVSCLGNDSLVPVYKNLLLNFLSDVSSMKFACSKILNLIKNMTAENSVPNITYDLFCETVVDKISAAGNFFTNNIEDIAHILTQFIVFPFEHKNYLKMKDNTIENLNMLHAKCCSEKVDKVVAAKINAEIAVKLYSTNVKSPLDTCEKRHRKNLFVLCNNVILNIFATVLERIEYDAESISIFLKLCSQMIIFMKKSSNSVFGEFQFGSEDFEKSLITIERLCSILKSLNVITIVKCLQEFVAVFDNILEIREISELSKFNVSVTNTVDDLCKYYINNYQIKLNENKSFDKVLKSFIPIFKKFAIDDKNIKEISALIQSGDTPSTTPIRTPTIFGKSPGLINSRHSPNCGTPKSKKCLEDDFIVVPKTPVRKPQYTEKQKEKMKERSADIPSLYNELSQQSQDCSSITTNNTIFTQSCPEPENVSILELSTSEFEKSELDKNTSKTGSFFNNEFSDLESGIEHFDKCHESVISNNSVVNIFINKSKLDDITNKPTPDDHISLNCKIGNMNGGVVVNVCDIDLKKNVEKSPDLISELNDSDKEKKSSLGKHSNFNGKNNKKRSRDVFDTSDSDSNKSNHDSKKYHIDSEKNSEAKNGFNKKSPSTDKSSLKNNSLITTGNTEEKKNAKKKLKNKPHNDLKKNSEKQATIDRKKTTNSEINTEVSKIDISPNSNKKTQIKEGEESNSKKHSLQKDNNCSSKNNKKETNSSGEQHLKKSSENNSDEKKKSRKHKISESESSEADSVNTGSRRLQFELKRISMDIKNNENFVNLGNRRSKTTPQKLPLLRTGKIRKVNIETKKLKKPTNNNKKMNKNKNDTSELLNTSNNSDNIDEIESFEEPKCEITENDLKNKPLSDQSKVLNWLENSSKNDECNLQTKIVSNKTVNVSVIEEDNISTLKNKNMSSKKENTSITNEKNILVMNGKKLSSKEEEKTTPKKEMHLSPKVENSSPSPEHNSTSTRQQKSETNGMEWQNMTPKQNNEIQTSTPRPAKDTVADNENIIKDTDDDSDNFQESIEMVGSSQECPSQSLFFKEAMRINSSVPFKHTDLRQINHTNDECKEADTKSGKVKNSIPMIVLHDAFDLKKGKNGVNEINENAGLKQLSSLDTSNLNTSRIIASPEQEDADERNNQLLNNTLDISPIRIDGPVPEIPSAAKESASTELLVPSAQNNLLAMNNSSSPLTHRSRLLSSSANKGPKSRSAHMLGLCNREAPIVESNGPLHSPVTKQRELTFSKHIDSPSTTNLRAAKLLKLSDKDLLTFKKDVPSPHASPSASILKRGAKRKLADDVDADIPPNKSKRVSFNDPIFTTKYLLKESVSSPQDVDNSTPCVRKQLIADEKFVMDLNNDNMELFCKPITVEDDFSKVTVPDSEEIMGIEKEIEMEKINLAEQETQSQVDTLDPLEDNVFSEEKGDTETQAENNTVEFSPTIRSKSIFPELLTCLDPVGDCIDNIVLKTKPEVVQRFREKLYTISDLARLTSTEVSKAPLRSPKIANLKRVLRNYARKIQNSESMSDKNDIEDEICADVEKLQHNDIIENSKKDCEVIDSDLKEIPDSELVSTQVCEILDNEYAKHTENQLHKSNDLKNNQDQEDPNMLERVSETRETEQIPHSSLVTKNIIKDSTTKEKGTSMSDDTFVFDSMVLKEFLQKHFDSRPLETYEIVQDLIKKVLEKTYK